MNTPKLDNDVEKRIREFEEHARWCPECQQDAEAAKHILENLGDYPQVFDEKEWKPFRYAARCWKWFTREAPVYVRWAPLPAAFLAAMLIMLLPLNALVMVVSSVKWDPPSSLMSAGSTDKKPSIAPVFYVGGRARSWPEQRISALYRALEPTANMKKRYDIWPPNKVEESLQGLPDSSDKADVAKHLGKAMKRITAVLIGTVNSRSGKTEVWYEILDPCTGKSVKSSDAYEIPVTANNEKLKDQIKDSAVKFLDSWVKKRHEPPSKALAFHDTVC